MNRADLDSSRSELSESESDEEGGGVSLFAITGNIRKNLILK
jgi:hypothetical protein